MYHYKAKLIRVIDGDTVELEVDLGFNVKIVEKFRLYGIDAPERFTEDGKVASDCLKELLVNKDLVAATMKDKKEKYGRYLVMLKESDSTNNETVADKLVSKGLAKYKQY